MKKIITFSILSYLLFTINSNAINEGSSENNLENSNFLKIGVLLPLSGKFQVIGESFLKAIQLALYDISNEDVKIHEEFIRGNIESMENLTEPLKGELTVVLSEIIKKNNIKKEIHESVKIEIKKMLKKYTHKDVVEFVSKKENLPKKMIYNYCLKLKK